MLILNDQNFEEKIIGSDKPVLVDFWAGWCHPCFVMNPILEKLAEEFKEKFILAKVNLEKSPIIAQKYGINIIPTVLLFKDGKPVQGFVGVQPEEMIKKWLEENLKE